MTLQGFSRLVRHGEAWCEDRYYLGLAFLEVLRGTLLEEGGFSPFSVDFAKWRQALVPLGVALHKRENRCSGTVNTLFTPWLRLPGRNRE